MHLTIFVYAEDFSVTLTGIGITAHGIKPGEWAAHEMKNKITADGRVAYNPQAGLIVKTEHWQYTGTYLRDCFNADAALVGAGPKVNLGNYFSIGSIFGFYGRDGREGNKLPLTFRVKGFEVTPFAAGTFSVEIPITKHISVESNTAINFFINHSNVGLKLKF
jgi:hypothetical protein